MYSGTHVSFNATLYRIQALFRSKDDLPIDAVFQGYGRLVHPKGSYIGAQYVALYWSENGCYVLI